MPGDDFLSLVKAAWKASHALVSPPVMKEARHIQATEDLAGGLALLEKPAGRSL